MRRDARVSRVLACDNRVVRLIRRDAIVDQLKAMDRRAEERHEQLLERSRADERIFIEALTDIDQSIKRNNERLEDMGEAIRANTRAVLAVLDRLGPATG